MKCYFCFKKLKEVIVSVGWAKEVHPDCYEPYLCYIRQIKEAHETRG